MNADDATPPQPEAGLPASTFSGSVGELIHAGTLRAPVRPGLLAGLNRFEILSVLGTGGMGIVFLARDSANGQRVAIKVLKPEIAQEPRAVRYFLNEARHIQRLQHPHILPALEVCDAKTCPYFVMPHVEAGSLARHIQPGRPLEEDLTLSVACQIAEALRHAHSKGIIHRDLKPANVLIDIAGHAWLTDFGLARSLLNPSVLDADGVHREGTAAYLSPQAAAGDVEDTRGDIYAFGALLYEMLTGELPYEEATPKQILDRIRNGPPRPITSLNPKASLALVKIAEGAMAREHRDRYASMADVVADLERIKNALPPLGPRGRAGGLDSLRSVGKPVAIGAGAFGLVFLIFFLLWPTPRLKLVRTILSPAANGWSGAKLGNFYGPNQLAFFLFQDNKQLAVSMSGELLGSYLVEGEGVQQLRLNKVADVWAPDGLTHDGKDEPLISWTQGTNLNVNVLNQYLEPVKRFHAIAPPSTLHGGAHDVTHMQACEVADLDGDGRRELLALVNTGYDLNPRGVYCFDFKSETQRWHALIAPGPTELRVVDFEKDGKLSVIIGSGAVCNGNRFPDGTDDLHSYLFAFSHTGNKLWARELGDHNTYVHPLVADLDGDGRAELLAWVEADAHFRTNEIGRILKFDQAGNELARYDAGVLLLSCLAEDLDNDGRREIIATDRLGFVHVLNADLKLLRKVNVVPKRYQDGDVNLYLDFVTNLTHAAARQIVLHSSQHQIVAGMNPGVRAGPVNLRYSHDNSIIVLDASLKQLASYVVAPLWQTDASLSSVAANLDNDPRPEIVVFSKEKTALVLKFNCGLW